MIRIGIVGCGRILAAHLRGYRLLREAGVDDFCITALCARRPEDARMYVCRDQGPTQRAAVSQISGDPLAVEDEYLSDFQPEVDVNVYTDFQELIAAGPIDAVNDFTLHSLHHQIAAVATAHGKHLLTQKPLASNIALAKRMCEDAEAKNLILGVFENARNKPLTRHLHWLFHESELCGQLQMALIGSIGAWWAPDRVVAQTPWRHQKREAGGITLDLGVHQANLIRYLAGEITTISGQTATVEKTRRTVDAEGHETQRVDCDADDTLFASFVTQRGVIGSLSASWAGHGEKTLLGEGAVFYGSAGRVTGDILTRDDGSIQQLSSVYDRLSSASTQQSHFPLGLTDAFALNQFDWLDSIRQRRQPETSGWEGLRDLAVALAILESDLAGRRVEVEEVLSGDVCRFQNSLACGAGPHS